MVEVSGAAGDVPTGVGGTHEPGLGSDLTLAVWCGGCLPEFQLLRPRPGTPPRYLRDPVPGAPGVHRGVVDAGGSSVELPGSFLPSSPSSPAMSGTDALGCCRGRRGSGVELGLWREECRVRPVVLLLLPLLGPLSVSVVPLPPTGPVERLAPRQTPSRHTTLTGTDSRPVRGRGRDPRCRGGPERRKVRPGVVGLESGVWGVECHTAPPPVSDVRTSVGDLWWDRSGPPVSQPSHWSRTGQGLRPQVYGDSPVPESPMSPWG